LPQGEIGAIQVKGPNVFKGYWRMPEKTQEEFTADGWFKTGDVGYVDERGYVRIVGRSKDLIISGGYNVYPAEIEGYINELPGVAESALVGVPHPDFGEVGVAVVIAKPGASLEPDAIVATLKSKLANFKIPKRCFVVDELPRNTMGKVQKNLLREQHKFARAGAARSSASIRSRSPPLLAWPGQGTGASRRRGWFATVWRAPAIEHPEAAPGACCG
jgi:malonyl-CoA/methylmalonyl-CoA synthetase